MLFSAGAKESAIQSELQVGWNLKSSCPSGDVSAVLLRLLS